MMLPQYIQKCTFLLILSDNFDNLICFHCFLPLNLFINQTSKNFLWNCLFIKKSLMRKKFNFERFTNWDDSRLIEKILTSQVAVLAKNWSFANFTHINFTRFKFLEEYILFKLQTKIALRKIRYQLFWVRMLNSMFTFNNCTGKMFFFVANRKWTSEIYHSKTFYSTKSNIIFQTVYDTPLYNSMSIHKNYTKPMLGMRIELLNTLVLLLRAAVFRLFSV